jgi:lysophospholipase L1-like esterase
MARAEHYRFADLSRKFLTGKKVNAALFMADGLHPNAAGYMVLGEALQRLLGD